MLANNVPEVTIKMKPNRPVVSNAHQTLPPKTLVPLPETNVQTDAELVKDRWRFVIEMPTVCLSKKPMTTLVAVKQDTKETAAMATVLINVWIFVETRAFV